MIRYDKKLNSLINKTIRNFNQKISRLEKEERELLPTKVYKKELKSETYSRKELLRKLKEMQHFSQRGVEEVVTTSGGVKLTKYELNKIKQRNRIIKARLTREITKMKTTKPKVFGKEQAVTFAEMGEEDYLNLVARRKALEKDIEKLDTSELNRLRNLQERTIMNQEYYDNIFRESYIKMLNQLGYYFNYDKDKIKNIEENLRKLNPTKFYKLFKDDKSIKAILDYYPSLKRNFKINPKDIEEDVKVLYDNLNEHIENIIKKYE